MSAKEERTVVVIGCGGIWSYLWKPLCRMLTYTKEAPKRILLVDGDYFVRSNLERQDMVSRDLMRNKAVVYADRIKAEFPELAARAVPEFVTSKNIESILFENTVVVSAVDNHATRALLAGRARSLKDCVIITGASDMINGNVHVHIIKDGKPLTQGIDESHPEVTQGRDRNPGDMSCEERAMLPGGGQQIVSNVFTAAIMVSVIWKLFTPVEKEGRDISEQSEVFYDLNHLAMDTTSRAVNSMKGNL